MAEVRMIARRDPIDGVMRRDGKIGAFAASPYSGRNQSMAAVAYGIGRLLTTEISAAESDGRKQGFFIRLLRALDEARRLQARRVVERYAHLLPPGHDWCFKDEE